jgi:NADPH:quinone reductase
MADRHGLTIVRVFDAPPERLWAEWTTPAAFADWFGGAASEVPLESVTMDVRPGGTWRATMFAGPDRVELAWAGEYLEVDPPVRLVLTMTDRPQDEARERVTVELLDLGDGRTEMRLEQRGHMTPQRYRATESGWGGFFDRMAERLGPGPAAPGSMRALVFTEPAPDAGRTRVDSLAVPEPGAGEVAIDVEYAGINFKDVMARRGDRGYVASWPFVPGLEVAGTVRAVGAGVDAPGIGDRVTAFTDSGGLAEVAIARAALVAGVPPGLALERAAVVPGALTSAALLVVDAAHLGPDETVLVHSAGGGVGQAVVQLARAAGARRVLGTVGSRERVAGAERAGYDAVLVRGPELAAAIREASGDAGVDVVLDPQGTTLLDVDLAVAAPGARIVLFGNATGRPPDPLPPVGALSAANVSVGGFSLAAYAAAAPQRVRAAMTRVLDLLAAGELTIELRVVDGLERAADIQQELADGRGSGKRVIRVGDARRPRRSADAAAAPPP